MNRYNKSEVDFQELRLGGNSNACATLFQVQKGFVCVVCPFYACFLVYFLSFCTKEWTRGRRVMDQPITPHVDLDPQPPIPLVVVYGAFPINSEAEKNGKPEAANMVFQVFLYPITFLCPSINFLSPKKKPFRLCKNHFISQKICQQQILPNCRGNYERPLLPHHLCYILTYMTMYQQIVLKADMPEILVCSPPPMAHILQQRVIRKTC